jgi:hypothetical protein
MYAVTALAWIGALQVGWWTRIAVTDVCRIIDHWSMDRAMNKVGAAIYDHELALHGDDHEAFGYALWITMSGIRPWRER